jgi:hypothetical protein
MNKRPGHVTVTTEVGYCNFCQRTRNLRREDHQLGQLVRTIVACETCHRTLSSTIGVAAPPEPAEAEAPVVEAAAAVEESPTPRRAPANRKPAAAAKPKPAAAAKAKPTAAAKAKPAAAAKAKAAAAAKAKKKTPAKPRSTATRPTTRKK